MINESNLGRLLSFIFSQLVKSSFQGVSIILYFIIIIIILYYRIRSKALAP